MGQGARVRGAPIATFLNISSPGAQNEPMLRSMNRLIVVTALLSLSLSAPVFATCPTTPSPAGLYASNFSQDEACYSLTGTISSTSVACGTFSVAAGDTVSIKIYVGNSGSANIQASIPRVFNSL